MDRVQELYDKGLNDESIARLLGVSRSHVSKLRREIGLPARRERHPYGPRQPKAV
jgi:predicted transcriptional regulator